MNTPVLLRFSRGLLLLVTLLAGCQRTPPLERKVDAATPHDLVMWQQHNRDDFAAADWTEFEAALQELKLKIVALKEASGSDPVAAALCPKVDGHAVRDVIREGYEARLWRLGVQRDELKKMLQENATLTTRPGDAASADYLARKQQKQTDQLDQTLADIQATEKKLADLAQRK